ncbi:MAG: biotin--[acetyl-CoA-carboxylase] ligase [Bacteroidales bacterium]|nr:biotin--[acetyl-CoA-carboxylase] ligase [Bacteroidales bacterium]
MKTAFNIIFKERVSSTNDDAKKLLQTENVPDFTVISANEQLIGKGQRKNSWHSEAGKNLTFSIITFPVFLKIPDQFYLSKVISLGILEYLKTKGKYFKIKWPNDIYCKDKKICGLLIENSIAGSTIKNSVIGIGLNINQTVFPKDLPKATSLSIINDTEYLLSEELNNMLSRINKFYNDLKNLNFSKTDKLYHNNLYKINELSEFKDSRGRFLGKITGTEPEGKLIIQTVNNEIRTYNFKEVEFI